MRVSAQTSIAKPIPALPYQKAGSGALRSLHGSERYPPSRSALAAIENIDDPDIARNLYN